MRRYLSRTRSLAVSHPFTIHRLLAEYMQAGVSGGCDKTIGNLIYTTATKLSGDAKQAHRRFLAAFIAKGELSTAQQLTEAIKYLDRLPAEQPVNEAEFKDASGVGTWAGD